MKAVVLEALGTLAYQDVPTPEPAAGQVLIRVRAASVCGSDLLRTYQPGAARVLPIILGHECAGEITAVGDGVPPERIGQRVALVPLIPCMTCRECAAGLYACCKRYSFIGSRVAGGFAEYVVVPAANAIALPDGVEMEIGALAEPTTVTLHALDRGGGAAGKTVAIFGVGSIGLLAVQTAHLTGAAQVIAVDVAESNLDAAREFGAQVLVNPAHEDALASIRTFSDGGADLVLEVSGSPAALEQAVHAARPGGHVVFVGNQPTDGTLKLDLIEHAMRSELNLHGAWMSYSAPFPGQEWTTALDAMAAGTLHLREMISRRVPLEALPETMAQMRAKAFPYRKVAVEYPASVDVG